MQPETTMAILKIVLGNVGNNLVGLYTLKNRGEYTKDGAKECLDAINDLKNGNLPKAGDEEWYHRLTLFLVKLEKVRATVKGILPEIMRTLFDEEQVAQSVFVSQFISGNLIADSCGLGRCGELCAVFLKCLMQHYNTHPSDCKREGQDVCGAGDKVPFDIILLILRSGNRWNHTLLFLSPIGASSCLVGQPPKKTLEDQIAELSEIENLILVDPTCQVICSLDNNAAMAKLYGYLSLYGWSPKDPMSIKLEVMRAPPISFFKNTTKAYETYILSTNDPGSGSITHTFNRFDLDLGYGEFHKFIDRQEVGKGRFLMLFLKSLTDPRMRDTLNLREMKNQIRELENKLEDGFSTCGEKAVSVKSFVSYP